MNQSIRFAPPVFYRILSMTVAIVLAASLTLNIAVQIKIRSDGVDETENIAASYLMENTEYIQQSKTARAGDYLLNELKPALTFEDYYLAASVHIAQANYEKALVTINQCIGMYEGGAKEITEDLWIKQGCLHALLGEYDEAFESFSNVPVENGNYTQIVLIETQIYLERNQMSEAKALLKGYHAAVPGTAETQGLLAEIYYLSGDYHEAESVYSALIGDAADETGINSLMRGLCREQTGDYANAVLDFSAANAAGCTDDGVCYEHTALCSYMLKDYTGAIENGNKALTSGSKQIAYGYLYNCLGLSALMLGQYEESAEYFTSAAAENEDLQGVWYYIGIDNMALANYAQAIDDFSVSIKKGEEVALCCYNRGLCYMLTGNFETAREDFETVRNISEDDELAASAALMTESIQSAG